MCDRGRRRLTVQRLWLAGLGAVPAAIGAWIFVPGYRAGTAAQAHQDRDLARVAVNFAAAGVYRTPLRINAAALRYHPAGRGVAVSNDLPDDPVTWAAVAGGAGRYTLTDRTGTVVTSGDLKYPGPAFHGRGLPCGFLPLDLPIDAYQFEVRVDRPTPGAGVADVFVWDRLHEFTFIDPLVRCVAGLPFLLAGATLLSAAAAWPWIVRLVRWATHRSGRGADAHPAD